MDIFASTEPQYLGIRYRVEEILDIFSKISVNPFINIPLPEYLASFPIRWNINQLYFIINSLDLRNKFHNYCFIIIDEESKVLDSFIIRKERQLPEDRDLSKSHLDFHLLPFEDTEQNTLFIKKLEENVKNRVDLFELVNSYIGTHYKIKKTIPIILPYDFRSLIEPKKIPIANLDLLGFIISFLGFRSALGKVSDQSEMGYIISQFKREKAFNKFISNGKKPVSASDLEKWSIIWSTLLDDLMANIIVVREGLFIVGLRLIVEDNKITVNPLPGHILKDTFTNVKSDTEIAKEIAEKTGLRTLVVSEYKIWDFLKKIQTEPIDLLEMISNTAGLILSCTWYPDSLLNSFLKLFGFQLGSNVDAFPDAFETVIHYFKHILIITYRISNDPEVKSYQTLIHMHEEKGKFRLELFNAYPYKEFLKKCYSEAGDRINEIKQAVEKRENVQFNACLGFDINILSESLSARNIQALLQMDHIAHQLPFVASIGALFAGMKALNVENAIDSDEDALLTLYNDHTKENEKITDQTDGFFKDRMKFVNYFDAFLKKGIFLILNEEGPINRLRSPLYSKDGYLGFDMDAVRDYIASKKEK